MADNPNPNPTPDDDQSGQREDTTVLEELARHYPITLGRPTK